MLNRIHAVQVSDTRPTGSSGWATDDDTFLPIGRVVMSLVT